MRRAGGLHYPHPEPPAPGAAVEIAEGVLWLRLPLPFRPDHLNVYALDEGDGWTIVDAGLDTPACREWWQSVLAGPLAGRPELDRIGCPPGERRRQSPCVGGTDDRRVAGLSA